MLTTLCFTFFIGSFEAEAKTINLAKGKRVFLESNGSLNGSFGRPLSYINDGNYDSVLQFYEWAYNPVYIDLGDKFVVTGFKIDAKSSGNRKSINVRYYDSDMNPLNDVSGSLQDSVKVANVRYVSLRHVDKESLDVREFEVYGSDGSVSEVTGFKGNPDINKISLSWTNPIEPNFKGVKIYKNNTLLATVDADKNSYVVEGLEDNKNYSFKITTLDDKGTESVGVYGDFTTLIDPKKIPPDVVGSLAAEPTDKTVKLSWKSPKDKDLKGFKILSDGKEIAEVGLQEEFEVKNLKPDTKYKFTVVAVDEDGNISKPKTVEVITKIPVLSPPKQVVPVVQNGSLIISWDIVESKYLKGYNVYIDGKKVNDKLLTTNRLNVKGLENGKSYKVQVSAVNISDVEGEKSSVVTESPSEDAITIDYDVVKLPFSPLDLLTSSVSLLAILGGFVLLSIVIYWFRPLKELIVKAVRREKDKK